MCLWHKKSIWNPPALISVVWHVLKITAWDHHRDQQGRCPHVIQEICTVPCPLYYPLHCTLSFVQDTHLSNAHNTYFWDHFKTSQMLLLYRYTKAKHVTHVHRFACLVYGIWYCNIWNIVHIWDISAMAPFCWFVSIISFATPCAPSARLSDRRYLWS